MRRTLIFDEQWRRPVEVTDITGDGVVEVSSI